MLIYAAPGLFYGLTLVASSDPPASGPGAILFIPLSVGINILCVYQIFGDLMDNKPYVALKQVSYSAIGAVMLSLCYDTLVARRFSLLYTIALPTILGIAASLFSAGCMYLLVTGKFNEFTSTVLWIGMFTTFPLWQYLFGLNVEHHNKARLGENQFQ